MRPVLKPGRMARTREARRKYRHFFPYFAAVVSESAVDRLESSLRIHRGALAEMRASLRSWKPL